MREKKLFTQEHLKCLEEIFGQLAKVMDGFRWEIIGLGEAPSAEDLKEFTKQESDSAAFEYEYVAQYGNGDSGHYGEMLFPICGKFIRVRYCE